MENTQILPLSGALGLYPKSSSSPAKYSYLSRFLDDTAEILAVSLLKSY